MWCKSLPSNELRQNRLWQFTVAGCSVSLQMVPLERCRMKNRTDYTLVHLDSGHFSIVYWTSNLSPVLAHYNLCNRYNQTLSINAPWSKCLLHKGLRIAVTTDGRHSRFVPKCLKSVLYNSYNPQSLYYRQKASKNGFDRSLPSTTFLVLPPAPARARVVTTDFLSRC